jgi:hypothetical protein
MARWQDYKERKKLEHEAGRSLDISWKPSKHELIAMLILEESFLAKVSKRFFLAT